MKMKLIGRRLLVIFFLTCFTKSIYSQNIEINRGWEFARADEQIWRAATVPGTVHTDLMAQQLIPDPFKGTNEKAVQWVDKKDWLYRCSFDVSQDMLQKDMLELEFNGLDTYARVYLNHQLILTTNNMFIPWKAEVKKYLHPGKNELQITLESPIKHDMPLFLKDSLIYPAGNDASDIPLSVYARKAPYHYGWDWGPRLVTSGIWRPVILHAWNKATIRDMAFQQDIKPGVALVKNTITVEAAVAGNYKLNVVAVWNRKPVTSITVPAILKKGINEINVPLTIKQPQLWWPNGMGAQNLYQVKVKLFDEQQDIAFTEKNIGLRTIEVVNKPDSLGESFYVKVNGRPVFMKGANYIPQDNFLPRVTKEKYAQLFNDMQESHFNMVRVWGGGIYEDDQFYDLADVTGILVWQDFMYACTLYPWDPAFLDNAAKEATANINRLKHHPALALWCGNNEVAVAIKNWGWQNGYAYTNNQYEHMIAGYNKLFKEVLPKAVQENDPGRFYFHSSPISNWGTKEDFTKGDNHYWGIWHGMEWFEAFNTHIPRFMSEYGFQSFPAMETIDSFATKADYNIFSNVMQSHQKSPAKGNTAIKIYMDHYYRTPVDFPAFVYLSQVLQAEGMKMAIEAHRRNMPYCMGTLYWQLNDCWPGPSWSGRDYYGRWKALQYYAKRAFEPVITSTVEENGQLNTYLITDAFQRGNTVIKMKAVDLQGNTIWEKNINKYQLQDDRSVRVNSVPVNELLKGKQRNEVIFYSQLIINDNVLNPNLYYFATAKDINLTDPQLTIRCQPGAVGEVKVLVKTTQLARNVYISLDDASDEHFSDNFFDLLPGEERTIILRTARSAADVQQHLRKTTLIDSYNH